MKLIKKNNFDSLINNIYQTHCVLQSNAVKTVNYNLTVRNWLIGCYIVEYEQNGEDRAKYGTKISEELAKKIKEKGVKGLDARTIRACRKFYNTYPQIWGTLSPKLQQFDIKNILSLSNGLPILESLPAKLYDEYPISSDLLLSRLCFSHFLEIMRRDDPFERLFYEMETIRNNWSVRELERAIDTALFVRTELSNNKEAIIAKIKNLKPAQTKEVIRNPYFLEFLEIEEKTEYNESDLEELILNHLQQFLVELGTGFCFEARQKRITFDNTHYKIDLVFYHRILKSHILIDLKIGKFYPEDAGQMTFYLNYYKDNEMMKDDNPPIGIILCGDKNETLVKYSTNTDNQLFVSQYLVKLPKKKVLENFIKKELAQK